MRRNPFLFVVLCLIVLGAFFFRYLAPERSSRIIQVAEKVKNDASEMVQQAAATATNALPTEQKIEIESEEELLEKEQAQLQEVIKDHQQKAAAVVEEDQQQQQQQEAAPTEANNSEIDVAMERANALLQNAMKAAKEAREQIAIAQRELNQLSEARAGLDISKLRKTGNKSENKKKTDITPQAPASEIEKVFAENTVRFNWTKSVLTEEALTNIQNVAKVLKLNPNISVLVSGHTDSNGTDELNSWLGLIRARKVRDQLIALGISKKRIAVASRGAKDPLDTNETAEGRWKNRRVEFSLSEK